MSTLEGTRRVTASDWLGVTGLLVALAAFAISAVWNRTNERTLTQLNTAITTLNQRNADLSSTVDELRDSVAHLDEIPEALGRAAMAATPESFIALVLDEMPNGTTYGELCELGRARLYGEAQMFDATKTLGNGGLVGYDAPLSPSSRVWRIHVDDPKAVAAYERRDGLAGADGHDLRRGES